MKYSALAIALLLTTGVRAEVPRVFSYTGTLMDSAGNAVEDGNYTVTFRFFDAVEGGGAFWESTYSVSTVAGVFTALLGANSAALDPSLFARDQVWIELAVEGDTLSPRLRVVSVPYALSAGSLECEGCVQAADVDAEEVQVRVTGSCSGGQSVSGINEDGSVVCVNSGGSLVAGPGITIEGATISTSYTNKFCEESHHVCGFKVSGEIHCCADQIGTGTPGFFCPDGEKLVGWELNNTPACEPDVGGGGDGTVKEISTPLSGGLTGGPINDSGPISIATGGVQTRMIASHAVSQEFGTADLGDMLCAGGTWDDLAKTCEVDVNPVTLYSRVLVEPGLYLFFVHLNNVVHDMAGGSAVVLHLHNRGTLTTVDPDDVADTWDYVFDPSAVEPQRGSISRVFMYEKTSPNPTEETLDVNAFTDGGVATIGGSSGWAGHGAGMRVVLLKR